MIHYTDYAQLYKSLCIVISHDDNLKKAYGKEVGINEATLKQLKQLTENKIATLQEALEFIDNKAEKILVELKGTGYEKKVLDVVKKAKLRDRVIIGSFHEDALANVRELDEKIETGLIYAKHKNPIRAALELKAQYLVSLYRFTHTKNIEDAHKKNLRVIVWTINVKQEIQDYIAKGVDGIASDRPDLFQNIS